ncbi:MAG TPA: glutamate mutase L [Micromonosporaceae bacterium]
MTQVRPYADPATATDRDLVVCGDVGSTYTKVAVVDTASGDLVATADCPTTLDSDVLDGLDEALDAIAARYPEADLSRIRVCSSAGGGLRLAVVGYEQLVTAEAGQRVGLSAGARVVHVAAGRLDPAATAGLLAARPDIVLLVGGTDGGDEDVLRHNAAQLATSRLATPIVLAGNVDARADVAGTLRSHGKTVLPTDNVLPRIGVLHPQPARAAIREVFLRHVIGGKKLSWDPRFAHLVRGATPDLVLTAVELLADRLPSEVAHVPDSGGQHPGVVVVDVGGATTDVYSVLAPDPQHPAPERDVAGTLWRSRTVEGDLGVRWNAPGVVIAAVTEGLLAPDEAAALHDGAALRAAQPNLVGEDTKDLRVDQRLAELAITIALRRHARGERIGPPTAPRRGGKDLGPVRLVIGSGGVLRHAAPSLAATLLGTAVSDHAGGWPLPRRPRHVVDHRYVLAAAGLLADDHPDVATHLIHTRLLAPEEPSRRR